MLDNYLEVKKKIAENYYQEMIAVELAPLEVPSHEWKETNKPWPYHKVKVNKESDNSHRKEGNNPMDDKVYYLENRVNNIECSKYTALSKQFGMRNAPAPKTFADLVAAIKAGNYIAPGEGFRAHNPLDGIQWSYDNTVKDEAGYNLAVEALKKAQTIAMDIVQTQDPATAGLAAVQAFEAWTYSPSVDTTSVSVN